MPHPLAEVEQRDAEIPGLVSKIVGDARAREHHEPDIGRYVEGLIVALARRRLGVSGPVGQIALPSAGRGMCRSRAKTPWCCCRAMWPLDVGLAALHRLQLRMASVGTPIFAVGPHKVGAYSSGFDTPEAFSRLPGDYKGGITTDRSTSPSLCWPLLCLPLSLRSE